MSIVRAPRRGPAETQLELYGRLARALMGEPSTSRMRGDEARAAFAGIGPVVYYVWRHNLIKIGHMINLRNRMMNLNVSAARLLALELGPMELEKQRHIEFVADRVHGDKLGIEHYWPSMQLMGHINDLRVEHGQPALMVGLRPLATPRTRAS